MRWVLSDITQSSVSIIQIVWVPQMMVCLDEFWIMVFVTRWFKNWWQSSKIKTAETCFQNSKTITQWHVHKPFFFSPLLHCSFFLSSSLSILLFFLLQSKKLILTDHSHVQCSFCFLSIQCSLCSFFFVLSFLFFLFFSHRSLARRPKPRDHRCRSLITRRKAPPRTCSPHHCYRARSSIWPKHRNRHPQQQRISVGKDSIWKLYCRCREQLHWKLVFDLEAQFYFFMFFISWCIINKYEWSFEFGVMTCFRWC